MQAEPEYAERLRRAFRERLMAHRTFLDDFEFVDLTLEGGYPNQRLVLLFRRTGSDDCLWGSRSANLWSRHDHPPPGHAERRYLQSRHFGHQLDRLEIGRLAYASLRYGRCAVLHDSV